MAGHILTTATTVMCTHGGQATPVTTNARVFADGSPAMLETDIHVVAGCPFTIGQKYSPCVRIEWEAGAVRVNVNGTGVLVRSSVGKCISAEGALQGVATVINTQMRASAQ